MAFAGLIFIAISLIRAPESMIPYSRSVNFNCRLCLSFYGSYNKSG
jgi:hypothetical protein